MANNNPTNDNRQQGGGQYDAKQYDPERLFQGLFELTTPLNTMGIIIKEKASVLAVKFEDMIEQSLGIQEIDHVAIKPKLNRSGGIETVLCRAYFNTENVTSGNLIRRGAGNGINSPGVQTIIPLVGNSVIGSGEFEPSDHFMKVFAPLSLYDDGRIDIGSIPNNKWIAVLELDFFALAAIALSIKSDSPYDFSVITAFPIGSDGRDYNLVIEKVIDTRTNKKRGRHGKGNRVNYNDLDREWAKQNDAYYGKRSFQ